jgi:hypothetical protein
MHSIWLRLRDWFATLWAGFEGVAGGSTPSAESLVAVDRGLGDTVPTQCQLLFPSLKRVACRTYGASQKRQLIMPPAPVASSVASPVTVVAVAVARIVAVTVSIIGVTVAVVVVGVVSITRIPIIPVAVVGVAAGADVDVDLCGCLSGCKHRYAEKGHCDRINSQ